MANCIYNYLGKEIVKHATQCVKRIHINKIKKQILSAHLFSQVYSESTYTHNEVIDTTYIPIHCLKEKYNLSL